MNIDLTYRRGPQLESPALQQTVLQNAWDLFKAHRAKFTGEPWDGYQQAVAKVVADTQHLIDRDVAGTLYALLAAQFDTTPEDEEPSLAAHPVIGRAITELAYRAGFYPTPEHAWLDWYWSYERAKGADWTMLLFTELYAPIFVLPDDQIRPFFDCQELATPRATRVVSAPEQLSLF